MKRWSMPFIVPTLAGLGAVLCLLSGCAMGTARITVRQGATVIVLGTGSFDAGSVVVGGAGSTFTFVIENPGDADLKLLGNPPIAVNWQTGDPNDFSVVTQPATLVPPGNHTEFTILFHPAIAGTSTASIFIECNAEGTGPGSFAMVGRGFILQIEMAVSQGSQDIPNGGSASFGAVAVDSANVATFTITNNGADSLNLTGTPLVEKSGTDAALFTIASPPEPVIAPGAHATFDVSFSCATAGSFVALLSIPSDDPVANPFSFSITATAIVPVSEVPATGQKSSVSAGDDGSLQRGVSWPTPRFTDNGDGTMSDALTGLMWEKSPPIPTLAWSAAVSYANDLVLAGHEDWRLPNISELESLLNAEESSPTTWLASQGFTAGSAFNVCWSSTVSNDQAYAWGMWMDDGRLAACLTSLAGLYRAVRDSPPGLVSLAKTGRTLSFHAGDDGDLQTGAAWPSPRFIYNANGTITDALTGLMWEASPSHDPRSLEAALAYAAGLRVGGFADWRVPNRKELRSLVTYAYIVPDYWLYQQGFNLVLFGEHGRYVSSTRDLQTGRPWIVTLNAGGWFIGPGLQATYLIAVRGGR